MFASQLINLIYTKNLGEFSYLFIGIAAFTTMFSTTLTTLDASPRAMTKTSSLLFDKKNKFKLLVLDALLSYIGNFHHIKILFS